ncbi:MAG: type II secretion system minor pseudopilin GspK [Gammaproteobacteria bacterium]|nr:type II secretion system minor pseudopilin GspK [Gammaproteobacteria bacterium]
MSIFTGSPRNETGVALISAVLVVAITSISAVAMTHSMQLSIHRTTNVLLADQRFLYTLGSEAWSRGQLIRDQISGESYDALNEDWAKELPLTVLEEGRVHAKTFDLQGRFNLNNLYLPDNPSAEIRQRATDQIKLFKGLLKLLELDEAIAQATSDWLDQDTQPQYPDGAEDNEYLGQTPPSRTANTMMAHPSELRLIKGVTSETYQKLSPYVTALPEFTQINVNTADAIILRAMIQTLDESLAESLLLERDENPYRDTAAFLDRLKEIISDNEEVSKAELETLITVSSSYFQLETTVRTDEANQRLRSLLHRTDQGIDVLSRTLGDY